MIFYFSGSGGTRWAAENLGLGDEVVDLGGALRFGELEFDLTREQREQVAILRKKYAQVVKEDGRKKSGV